MLHKVIWVTSSLLGVQRSNVKLQRMRGLHEVTKRKKQKEQDGDSSCKATAVFCILWKCQWLQDTVLSFFYDLAWTPPHLWLHISQCQNLDKSHYFLLGSRNWGLLPSNKTRTQPSSQHISVISVIRKKVKDCVKTCLSKQASMKEEIARICFPPLNPTQEVLSQV